MSSKHGPALRRRDSLSSPAWGAQAAHALLPGSEASGCCWNPNPWAWAAVMVFLSNLMGNLGQQGFRSR